MGLLQGLKSVFVVFDGGLKLLDVFRAALTESCLCLAVALFPLLGRCVYLQPVSDVIYDRFELWRCIVRRTGLRPPFLFCGCGWSGMISPSCSGDDGTESSETSPAGSSFVSSTLSPISATAGPLQHAQGAPMGLQQYGEGSTSVAATGVCRTRVYHRLGT